MFCIALFFIEIFFFTIFQNLSEDEHLLTRGGREVILSKFLLPALLDAVACILMFTGLYLTYASSFQMIRGKCLLIVCYHIYNRSSRLNVTNAI